jgi:hypothetical protein
MKVDISDMAEKLAVATTKTDAALLVFGKQAATKLENSAKRNARWTDRTGSARGRLKAEPSLRPNGLRISLAHGVDYGIWLELANEKRYAIIEETIREVGSREIMPALNKFMEGLGRGI